MTQTSPAGRKGLPLFPQRWDSSSTCYFATWCLMKGLRVLSEFFSRRIIRIFLRKSYIYWMFALFATLVIFTGNRISLLALLVCFLYQITKQEIRFRSIGSLITMLAVIPILIAGSALLIMQTAAIYERSAGLFSLKNLQLAGIVWEQKIWKRFLLETRWFLPGITMLARG